MPIHSATREGCGQPSGKEGLPGINASDAGNQTCGVALAPASNDYDAEGRATCASCASRAEASLGQLRAKAEVDGAATTAAVLGVGTFCLPFGLYVAVPAIIVGGGALVAARTRAKLGERPASSTTVVLAWLGLGFGVLRVALYAFTVAQLASAP